MALNEILASVSSISSWSVLLVVLLPILYLYSTRNFDYWEKQEVKTSRPWPFLGSVSFKKMQRIDEMDIENYKKYGRIFGYYIGNFPTLIVGEPELLRKILVKDFHLFRNRMVINMNDDIMNNMLGFLKGDEWKGVRNILTPTFTTGKLKQIFKLIEECSVQLVNHLKKFAKDGKPFEARQCCTSFAIDVIATCTFGTKINSLENPENEFLQNATKVFKIFLSKWFLVAFISQKLFRLIAPSVLPDSKLKYFANILEEIIESRKKEQEPRKDFLQLLLEAEYVEENETQNSEEKPTLVSSSKKILTRTQVLSQAIGFLVAGSETTTTTFCFVLYNLALNEECQEKLIQEIDTILQNNEGSLTYDVITQMQYLDMVISETLRIYPPVSRLERVCEEEGYKLTEKITLKKGMTVGVPVYCIHYDEEFYPNPHKFDPERFSLENRSARDPYTYLPFGYGPRNCVGMRFALLELKIGLIYLLKEFRVKKCLETKIPFERDISVFIQPKTLYLKLESRK